MFIIGITGGTGAGKTSAMTALETLGAKTIDCDALYHELLSDNEKLTAEINDSFNDVLTDGKVDRKKLGVIVFNDKDSLLRLNVITHKYVTEALSMRIDSFKTQGIKVVAIDAIALVESGLSDMCNIVVGFVAPVETRLSRIIKRDGLTKEQALMRINAQKPEGFFRENCDYIIENTFETSAEFEKYCMNYFIELITKGMGIDMSNRAELRKKIDDWFATNSDDMISDLSKLVAINSVRTEAEEGAPYGVESRAVLTLAQQMFEERGFEVDVFEDMMITVNYGPAPALMGILAHLDIVEVGDGWTSDPFKMTLRDGKLYGRGVIDNKGPSVAAMYALYCARDLCPDLKHGVQVILGSGEETGFDDVTQYLKKNTPPPNVFTPDAEYPVINIEKGRFMPVFGAKWEKDTTLPRIISVVGGKTPNVVPDYAEAVIEGFSLSDVEAICREHSDKTGAPMSVTSVGNTLKIEVEGKASHASMPERGVNAQTALIEMLASMPFADSTSFKYLQKLNKLFPYGDNHGTAVGIDMEDKDTGRITVNFSVLSFSECGFSGKFDSRTPGCADKVDLVERTRSALASEDINLTYHEITGCHHTPEDAPFVQKLLNLYEEYTGQPGKCASMGGLTYVHDIEGGVAFGCAMPGDYNNVHGIDEYIKLDQLILSAKMFTQAILDMCNNE